MLGQGMSAENRLDSSQLVSLDASGTAKGPPRPLFGLDHVTLSACMVEVGEPAWRGKQLAEALYRQRVNDLAGITTFSKGLRQKLSEEGWHVGRPQIGQVFTSTDGTERYLVEIDGQTVETVWMPEGDGGESGDGGEETDLEGTDDFGAQYGVTESVKSGPKMDRAPSLRLSSVARVGSPEPQPVSSADVREQPEGRKWNRATICVSSQVGCAVNCQFCLTAKLGLQRNLTAGEIAGQVVSVFARQGIEVGRDRVNLVFMGMGEPFLNYDNFMDALRILVKEVGLSPQRMTVSTSGIVPGIERFSQEPADLRPKLAISLNAPNDKVRAEVMPINRKWPIAAVIDAVSQVRLRSRERITFEYVLLGGVTDQPEHALEVGRLVRRTGLAAKVNLIAWNPGPGIPYATPDPGAVERFRLTLADSGVPTYLRKPRGRDIFAACGQLKRTVEG